MVGDMDPGLPFSASPCRWGPVSTATLARLIGFNRVSAPDALPRSTSTRCAPTTYCDDLNRVFAFFLSNTASGLYHLGGPRAVTLNQIGQIVNKAGGYDPALLRGCLRLQAGPIPPRAGNVSMNSQKLVALMGCNPVHPWPLDEELVPTDRDWHFRRSDAWPGSLTFLEQSLYRYPGASSAEEMPAARRHVHA